MLIALYTVIAYSAICAVIVSALHVTFAIGRNRIIHSCKAAVKDEILFREDRIKKYDWIDYDKINKEIEDLRITDAYLTSTPYFKMLFSRSFDDHASKIERYKILSKDAWIAERDKNDKILAERASAEKHQRFLDQDSQQIPAEYSIGQHALETLALRYGAIYSGRKIKIKKIRPVGMYDTISKTEIIINDCYLVSLCDLIDRKALAIIEKGTNYIKTFYPFEKQWFDINFDLETVLKGNENFSIKEIARFHIDRSKRTDERNPVERENTVWER